MAGCNACKLWLRNDTLSSWQLPQEACSLSWAVVWVVEMSCSSYAQARQTVDLKLLFSACDKHKQVAIVGAQQKTAQGQHCSSAHHCTPLYHQCNTCAAQCCRVVTISSMP